ncbi:MAG: hypothetical protein LBN23_03025 [Paludibacter sp.]|jgi:hypothetical protein|nr:hypothetical protein [Paludibacter sp.]
MTNKIKKSNKIIENGVVAGFKLIENGVVSGYKAVEDKCVETLFQKDSETTEG